MVHKEFLIYAYIKVHSVCALVTYVCMYLYLTVSIVLGHYLLYLVVCFVIEVSHAAMGRPLDS